MKYKGHKAVLKRETELFTNLIEKEFYTSPQYQKEKFEQFWYWCWNDEVLSQTTSNM